MRLCQCSTDSDLGARLTPRVAWFLRPDARSPGINTRQPMAFVQEKTVDTPSRNSQPFLTDVKTLRERARKNIATGGVTFTYQGDVKKTIEILQTVLATEIVCVLRYTMHAVAATGISSEGVKAEFAQHAKEEAEHMQEGAERINQLGGKPYFNPTGLTTRAASEYG